MRTINIWIAPGTKMLIDIDDAIPTTVLHVQWTLHLRGSRYGKLCMYPNTQCKCKCMKHQILNIVEIVQMMKFDTDLCKDTNNFYPLAAATAAAVANAQYDLCNLSRWSCWIYNLLIPFPSYGGEHFIFLFWPNFIRNESVFSSSFFSFVFSDNRKWIFGGDGMCVTAAPRRCWTNGKKSNWNTTKERKKTK